MVHQRLPRSLVWLSFVPIIFIIGFFAFHYSRLTDWPVGDDPAVHIETVKQVGLTAILHTRYPIPLLIFKGLHSLTGVDHPLLFVYLICSFLFFAGLSLAYFVWVGWGSWVAAIVAPILFVSDRWVNDGLRMGLLAEAFGWGVLFLALTSLVKGRWWAVLIWTVILAFSHPFALLVFGLIVLFHSLITLVTGKVEERRAIWILFAAYGVIGLLTFLVKRDLIQHFLNFMSTDPANWGDRTLWMILAGDNTQRLLIPIIAFLGLMIGVGKWDKPAARITLLLLGIGLFFSLNQLFGINFIPFRFYVYLDAAIAILAAVAVSTLLEWLAMPSMLSYPLSIMAALILLWPNYQVNQSIGHWQATNGDARAVMLSGDRVALTWIRLNTAANASFIADRRYAIWISSVGERSDITTTNIPYDETSLKNYLDADYRIQQQYIYYGLGQSAPPLLRQYYRLAFQDKGVSIWEKRNDQ